MATTYRVIKGSDVLTDCVQISFQAGRQALLDNINASTAALRFRVTSSNTTYLNGLAPNDKVNLQYSTNGTTWTTFALQHVADVTIEYGNPTSAGVYEDDYCLVTTEGAYADWGRFNGTLTVNADNLEYQIDVINATTSLGGRFSPGVRNFEMQAYEINQSAGDYLQFALNSINGRMRDYSTADRVDVYSPYGITNSTYTFTDSTPSSTAMTYQACTFDSLVDNYFTQVIIDFGGLVPVVVTSSGATEPYRVLQMNVKLFSGESIDYANYLIGVFDNPALEVSSLTCIGQAQSADDLAKICTDCINKRFAILFRGSTVYAICEGFTMSLDPGQTKVTYYFSTDNQYVADWLILDDSTNGKLDINRLGF